MATLEFLLITGVLAAVVSAVLGCVFYVLTGPLSHIGVELLAEVKAEITMICTQGFLAYAKEHRIKVAGTSAFLIVWIILILILRR